MRDLEGPDDDVAEDFEFRGQGPDLFVAASPNGLPLASGEKLPEDFEAGDEPTAAGWHVAALRDLDGVLLVAHRMEDRHSDRCGERTESRPPK